MKKLKRMQLSELENEMPLLDSKAQQMVVGGDKFYFNNSGVWYNTVYCDGDDVIIVDGAQPFVVGSGTSFHSGNCVGVGNRSGIVFEGVTKDLFEYFAYNTVVEWGMSYNGNGKKLDGIMSSNYDEQSVDMMPVKGYRWYIHNHPNGTRVCDNADFNTQYNYTKGVKSYQYNYKGFELYTNTKEGKNWDDLDTLERVYK